MKTSKTKKDSTPLGREDPVSEEFVRVLDEIGFVADQRQMMCADSYLPLRLEEKR